MTASQKQGLLKPFACELCGTRYTRSEHLTRHNLSRHANTIAPPTSRAGSAAEAAAATKGSRWRGFKCDICSKGFSRRDVLKRHVQLHEKQGKGESGEFDLDEEDNKDDIDIVGSVKRMRTDSGTPRAAAGSGRMGFLSAEQQHSYGMPGTSSVSPQMEGPSAPRTASAPPLPPVSIRALPFSDITLSPYNNRRPLGESPPNPPQPPHPNYQTYDQPYGHPRQPSDPYRCAYAPPNEPPPLPHRLPPLRTQVPDFRLPSPQQAALGSFQADVSPWHSHQISPIGHAPSQANWSTQQVGRSLPSVSSGYDGHRYDSTPASSSYTPGPLPYSAHSITPPSSNGMLDFVSSNDMVTQDGLAFLDWAAWGVGTVPTQAQPIFKLEDQNLGSGPIKLEPQQWPEPTQSFQFSGYNSSQFPQPFSNESFAIHRYSPPDNTTDDSTPGPSQSQTSHPEVKPKRSDSAHAHPFGYSHVPLLTEENRNKFSQQAILAQQQTCYVDKVEDIPPTDVLNTLLQDYFSKFALPWRVLHFATFDPNVAPFYLVLMLCAWGAKSGAPEFAPIGGSCLEIARRSLFSLADGNVPRTNYAYHYTHYMLALAILNGGTQAQLEWAQGTQATLLAYIRRLAMFKDPEPVVLGPDVDLEAAWREWGSREQIKRMGLAAVCYCTYASTYWEFDSGNIFMELSKASLPATDALFHATTAEDWRDQFAPESTPPKRMNMAEAIQTIFDPTRKNHETTREAMSEPSEQTFTLHSVQLIRQHMRKAVSAERRFYGLDGMTAGTQHRARSEAAYAFFEVMTLQPIVQMKDKFPGAAELNKGTLIHLCEMTGETGLTVAMLQRLVKGYPHDPRSPQNPDAKLAQRWAAAEGGLAARHTAWHAGQILGLSDVQMVGDSALRLSDPVSIFYATLALWTYSQHTLVSEPWSDSETPFRLDRLGLKTDPDIARWLKDGGRPAGLQLIYNIQTVEGREKLLAECEKKLQRFKRWRPAKLFGELLVRLQNAKSETSSESTMRGIHTR